MEPQIGWPHRRQNGIGFQFFFRHLRALAQRRQQGGKRRAVFRGQCRTESHGVVSKVDDRWRIRNDACDPCETAEQFRESGDRELRRERDHQRTGFETVLEAGRHIGHKRRMHSQKNDVLRRRLPIVGRGMDGGKTRFHIAEHIYVGVADGDRFG